MGHYIDASALIEIAKDTNVPGRDEAIGEITAAMEKLGNLVAEHLDVKLEEVMDEGVAFGGLCANFGPSEAGQACPEALKEHDPSSDWAQGVLE